MAEGDFDWRDYEDYIYERLKELGGSNARVEFDVKLRGRHSGIMRQVDALVTGDFGGCIQQDLTAAVDCKYFGRKLHIGEVDEFIGFVDDVATDFGFLISKVGFTDAAKRRAGPGIRLRHVAVIDLDRLPYTPDYDEAYYQGDYYDYSPYGPVGASITYWHHDNPEGYTVIPDEIQMSQEGLASGTDNELSWGDEESREEAARIVLRHHLGEEPDSNQVERFMRAIARRWEDGYPWVVYAGELGQA